MARILIVDDDVALAEMVHCALTADGHQADQVHSAAEAIVRLSERRYDLLISDISMPGEDGFSLVARMRSSGLADDLPVLFMTAEADIENRQAARFLGAAGFLPKPFDLDALAGAVQWLVARTPQATPTDGWEGDLSVLRAPDLCYLVMRHGRTYRITATNGNSTGELVLRDHRLVSARVEGRAGEPLLGEEAFLEVSRWTRGRFRVATESVAPRENVSLPFHRLVLQALEPDAKPSSR
ncbi:MAG: response regulator [Planctomycetes bacterium]|nr:response regulator [Planctomycetota bacterium]